jgi:hypothetical protein
LLVFRCGFQRLKQEDLLSFAVSLTFDGVLKTRSFPAFRAGMSRQTLIENIKRVQ